MSETRGSTLKPIFGKHGTGRKQFSGPRRQTSNIVTCEVLAKPATLSPSAAGLYLPEGRHPIILLFHHSNIPGNCGAKRS